MSSGGDRNSNEPPVHFPHLTGMTPSIITTINNTSPTPQSDLNNQASKTSSGIKNTNKRIAPEPYYESYIEDSFVGHWEREDDDFNETGVENHNETEMHHEDSMLYPSTIEFDFDSFGPESIIFAPPNSNSKVENQVVLETTNNSNPDKSQLVEESQNNNHSTASTQQTGDLSNARESYVRNQATYTLGPIDASIDDTQIDLRVIEPYKKVISHAGYCHHIDPNRPEPAPGELAPAVIIFSACYLPDRSRRDYDYVMDNLFLYVLSSLHELIADDYILIYLHNTQPSSGSGPSNSKNPSETNNNEEMQNRNNLPTFTWMKRCYQLIDRKLRKNLKVLYLVRPTFWLKTIVIMCKPFISSKFSRKIRFIEDMDSLKKCIPVNKLILPASADNL